MKKNIVEKTIDVPAEALELGIEQSQKLAQKVPMSGSHPLKRAKNYWWMLGPGLTTGASDDDPSGIATYSQAGAQFGFGLLWLAAFTFPLMAVVQEMCARIGLVTGRGLAANIKKYFPPWVLYVSTLFLFAANTFNIGADIGSMAKATQLLRPNLNFTILVVGFTLLIMLLQIFTPYVRYAKYLKWLALVLAAYIISALLAHPDWHKVAVNTLIPHIAFNKSELLIICAILGTTITPYLFFWQTSQEIEEEIAEGKTTIASRTGSNKKEMNKMRIDVWSGMFLSNTVMFFIIAACATVLFSNGITNINSAADAARALKPFAGENAYRLFAVGIIGMGLLAIPVMAGASSYAISESLGRRESLSQKLKQGYTFYGVIIISMLLGLGMNFIGLNPIRALIYSAVLNGIVAPVILVLILLIARRVHVMGEWKNKKLSASLGWVVTIFMAIAGIAGIYALFP